MSIRPIVDNRQGTVSPHTDSVLRNPRQRINAIPRRWMVGYVCLTVTVDVGRDAEELQGRLDEARQPKHAEDETADDDDSRQEEALHCEVQDGEDKEDAECAGHNHVRKEPVSLECRDTLVVSTREILARTREKIEIQMRDTHHGVPSSICVCTVMNHANIPIQAVEPPKTTMIQMFSCISGHWYRRRVSRYTRFAMSILASLCARCECV